MWARQVSPSVYRSTTNKEHLNRKQNSSTDWHSFIDCRETALISNTYWVHTCMRSVFITAGIFCVYVLQLRELWGPEKITAVISSVFFKARLCGYLESASPAGLPSKLGTERSFFLATSPLVCCHQFSRKILTRGSGIFVLNKVKKSLSSKHYKFIRKWNKVQYVNHGGGGKKK